MRREFASAWTDPERPTEAELETLRGSILTQAEKDFAAIYAAFGELENIPFQDRDKPRMRVPRMTSQEQQWLSDAGIDTLHALRSAKQPPVPQISPERFQVQLRRSRYKLTAGLAMVLISIAGMGAVFARVTQGPLPQQSGQAKAGVIGTANPYH